MMLKKIKRAKEIVDYVVLILLSEQQEKVLREVLDYAEKKAKEENK